MLTLRQAIEVKESIIEYLRSTFSFSDKKVDRAFTGFIEGMFKGPYISLRLPFKKAGDDTIVPLDIAFNEVPFKHQLEAFRRLTTVNGHTPQPTLLTTGTGSGKTEAFMYPLLDYCLKQKNNKGIKSIILYPMNALGTDQAKRFAEAIYQDAQLKGEIRVGLLIGESLDRTKDYSRIMTEDRVIEHRETIVNDPPDILMTNFKMLDLSLMRGEFDNLWSRNFKDNKLLKFLVFDELHTYEGAQGSDVAHLVRRLKLKLEISDGHLCPIGTSATIGKGDESKSLLADFASKVFGEYVKEDAVIGEERVEMEIFLGTRSVDNFIPTLYLQKQSELVTGDLFEDFVKKQLIAWGIDPQIGRIELGEELKTYKVVRDLINICNDGMITLEDLIMHLGRRNPEFRSMAEKSAGGTSPGETLITSILSLISYAASGDHGKIHPFLNLQVQLWVRELSGIVRVVGPEPLFKWRDEVDIKGGEKALPLYYCRECGAAGWLAVIRPQNRRVENNIDDAYRKYFAHDTDLYFMTENVDYNHCTEEYNPKEELIRNLDPVTLALHNSKVDDSFPVVAYRKVDNGITQHICPVCNTRNSINIIGQRVATLVSVATSQILASDLDNSSERDRKILIFTNGVQDAAHLAGFVEARNFRFTFRTALQTVINLAGQPVNLAELQNNFVEYWEKNASQTGKGEIDAYFLKFFPPDHKADVRLEQYKNDFEKFRTEFNNRVRWEVASEFGYNAKIGRTLEKTGSAGVFFNGEKIRETFTELESWLSENSAGDVTGEKFNSFLTIFLHRLRTRGGVDHPYLRAFRTGRSNYYLITQNVGQNKDYFLMRNFGRNTRLPKLITDRYNRFGVFDQTTRETTTNWFHNYAERCFPFFANNKDLVNEFYSVLLEVLSDSKVQLLDEKVGEEIRNFALLPESVLVGTDTVVFECDKCGNTLTTTSDNHEFIEGGICVMNRCSGSYHRNDGSGLKNYYKTVYNRGKSPRVFATDHTGLLDRKVREKIEIDFKTRPHLNSINVLAATSTLEMGIDVGSLNTVINASIPPTPANFLQRVGRAGRKTGSALVVNVCRNKGHDLYFFGSPTEMMDGVINTPGCFLEAKEILRRHFLAFCIDSWSKADPVNNRIPNIIRFIGLLTLEESRGENFLNKLVLYIKTNAGELLDKFENSYIQHLDQEYINLIKRMVEDGSLFRSIWSAFMRLKKEFIDIKEKVRNIDANRTARNLAPEDSEFKELDLEKRNLAAIAGAIKKKNVIEFMVNEGLLPNYAFPETGVTLKASIARKPLEEGKPFEIKELEVVRPAYSAIRDFVPGAYFYTQGYKLAVDAVNVASWNEECLTYRFCSECDNLEIDTQPVAQNCKKCGSESWQQPQNVTGIVKMSAFRSFNYEKRARLDDSSEERNRAESSVTTHFRFHSSGSTGSLVMKKIPFGIEFFRDVDLTEVNCGLKYASQVLREEIKINNLKIPFPGFIVCRYCGRVSNSHIGENGELNKPGEYHFPFCNMKETGYFNESGVPTDSKVFEGIFFMREVSTEAIKILLPVQQFETDSAIKLFKAGLRIGLSKYFRGNPEHLDLKEYNEHNFQTQRRDNFLVITDRVPGGTGYLSRLFNPVEFNIVLAEAYKAIKGCSCQYEDRDGCYNCIYTYGNQFERENLSRERAEQLFEQLVLSADAWDRVPNGLGEISAQGQVEESELEYRFVRLLEEYANNEHGFAFSRIKEDGKIRYHLEIKEGQDIAVYEIIPQYALGPADGVQYSTVADFLIRPVDISINGQPVEEILGSFKPLAVYLDGYQFHATKQNNRVDSDVRKRSGIINSGRFNVWVLTWEDLDIYEKRDLHSDSLADLLSRTPGNLINNILKIKKANNPDKDLRSSSDSFSRMLWFLRRYLFGGIDKSIDAYLSLFQPDFPNNLYSLSDIRQYMSSPELELSELTPVKQMDGYGVLSLTEDSGALVIRAIQKAMSLSIESSIFIGDTENRFSKEEWLHFWRVFNLIQFSTPKLIAITRRADLDLDVEPDKDIFSNFDEKYHDVVGMFESKGLAYNKEEYFVLTNEDSMIIAEAFLGLPDYKLVIDPLDKESERIFQQNGYKVYELNHFSIEILEAL